MYLCHSNQPVLFCCISAGRACQTCGLDQQFVCTRRLHDVVAQFVVNCSQFSQPCVNRLHSMSSHTQLCVQLWILGAAPSMPLWVPSATASQPLCSPLEPTSGSTAQQLLVQMHPSNHCKSSVCGLLSFDDVCCTLLFSSSFFCYALLTYQYIFLVC